MLVFQQPQGAFAPQPMALGQQLQANVVLPVLPVVLAAIVEFDQQQFADRLFGP